MNGNGPVIILLFGIVAAVFATMGWLVGSCWGSHGCADEAVSDASALWWRQEIELAKGRKAARELWKDGAR